jgi:phage-related baseplate assembly protein
LQTNIEYKKVLTADVLIKQAEKLPIQVMLDATCYPTYSPSTIKSIIISKIKTYIDSIKKLGGEFDRSDIVTIARNTDGVDAVDINTITIAVLGNTPQKKIVAKDNQYFQVQNIVVNVYTNDRIV